MQNLNADTSLGQLVVEEPVLARVFERLGIDYCCGGKRTLAAVCAEKGISIEVVQEELVQNAKQVSGEEIDWSSRSLTELADHIQQTHHTYLKSELPRLSGLLEKVSRVHGGNHPEIVLVRDIFVGLHAEMTSHMFKEEQILFPAIRGLESGAGAFHCGSVQGPIRQMEAEHESAGSALGQIRALMKEYAAPDDACASYQAVLAGLVVLETDLHQHIHKENNILFPQAIAREAKGA